MGRRSATTVLLALGLIGTASAHEAPDTVLSHGYAQLYDAASGLRWLDEFLLVKTESAPTHQAIRELAEYSSRLKRELEELARANPSISLQDDGLPLLERNKRKALQADRAKSLAPLAGARGSDFERTLLLTQSGVLNQLRFLAQAIADAETDTERRQYVTGVRQELDRLYARIVRLLDKEFFRSPARSPLGAAGEAPAGKR